MNVIGLISGTSVDGIDAALVNISGSIHDLKVELLSGATYPYPAALREKILAIAGGSALSVAELAALDDAIADRFAQAAIDIQSQQPSAALIGSHGQTVYHRPPVEGSRSGGSQVGSHSRIGYSLQLGRGAAIADLTGVTTISNFRAADIAMGGHGAPLVPPVDVALLSHPTYSRCVQNIGGIGNVAYLPALKGGGLQDTNGSSSMPHALSPHTLGWDTGPGNMLLDLAVQHLSKGTKTYDRDGAWAASGFPCQELVHQWLQQDFFHLPPPKSTGREQFGRDYLNQCLADAEARSLSDADLLATLTELTAASIAHSYRSFLPQMPDQILVCGGGSKNRYLKQRLQANLENIPVLTTDDVGLSAEFKEAIAFAVLAYWKHQGIPGNLPDVTGARMAVPLGEIHQVL